MRDRKYLWILLLLPLLVAGGYWAGTMSTATSSQAQRVSDLEKENLELHSKLEKLQQADPGKPADNVPPRSDRDPDSRQSPTRTEPRPFNENQLIVSLQESLASEQRGAAEKNSRIGELEREIQSLREETKRLTESQAELSEQVASSRQQAEQIQAQLESRQSQLSQSQTEENKLRAQIVEAGQKLGRVQKTMTDLQEIYSRRETHLANLLNRYRDVTRQYRAFAVVLENRSASDTTVGGQAGPELARIQDAISLAEEDMRQLNQLNAQAQRIRKQLEGK